jgi:hypothetical protein
MTFAIGHPRRHHWWSRSEAAPGRVPATARPLAVGGIGVLAVLLAAWGGIAAFVGPEFGYQPTSSQSWSWTTPNWLLHLVPGAVGVAAGMVMLALVAGRGSWRRRGLGLAGLAMLAAGAWFVTGPAAWPLFESSQPYASAASTNMGFLNQLGANLGPGILLAVLAGMALKAGLVNPTVTGASPEPASPPPPGATASASGPSASGHSGGGGLRAFAPQIARKSRS